MYIYVWEYVYICSMHVAAPYTRLYLLQKEVGSPVQNSIRTQRSSTRWPVTTHKEIQLYKAERVGSGSARLACLTEIWINPCDGMLPVTPHKRARST